MSPKQTTYYWRVWKAVCTEQGWTSQNCALNEKRHACHVQALGSERSSKEFTNAEFDRVLDLFFSLSRPGYRRKYATPGIRPSRAAGAHVPDQRPTKYHQIAATADPGERKRLLFRIGQMFPNDRTGRLNPYVAEVMQSLFKTDALDDLSDADLTLLRDTLVVRKRAINKREKIDAAKAPAAQPEPATSGDPY